MNPQYLKGLVDGIGFMLKFQKVFKKMIFWTSVAYYRRLNNFNLLK